MASGSVGQSVFVLTSLFLFSVYNVEHPFRWSLEYVYLISHDKSLDARGFRIKLFDPKDIQQLSLIL